jgi:hypothetical protein
MLRALAVTVLLASSQRAVAAAQGDWFASLYTGEGVELRNDERVFALFALLNAAGFDQGPVIRTDPVPRVGYVPVRALVRERVLHGDPELRAAADAWFDAHPLSLQKYLAWAVQSDAPPFAAGPKSRELAELKGFEQLMARAWTGWRLGELSAQVQGDYRKTLKAWLPVIDAPLGRAKALLRLREGSEPVLVVNLLDSPGEVRAVQGEGGQVFLIVGPSDKPEVGAVLRELARLELEPVLAKPASRWALGPQVLREAQLAGASDKTVLEYATSVASNALALRAGEAAEAAYEAAAARGAFGIKEVARLFDEAKSLEAVSAEVLQKIETRRPVKK